MATGPRGEACVCCLPHCSAEDGRFIGGLVAQALLPRREINHKRDYVFLSYLTPKA